MQGTYDIALVIASYCVAVFASYAALDLGGRIAMFDGPRERFWLFAGALAMGTGIWSTHFVGMKALNLPVAVTYDLPLTVLSWLAAVGISVLALHTISRSKLTVTGIATGSLVMGFGICVMHFSGMWAMRMNPGITYDLGLVAASAVIAVVASAGALFICFSVRQLPTGRVTQAKILAALVMAAAICGAHYTGTAAANFAEGARCNPANALAGNWMGLPVALITVGLLIAILLLSLMDARAVADRRRAETARVEAERVRRLAYYDAVTELPNRSLFNETLLKQLINVSGKAPPPFGVVYGEVRGYRALVERLGQERVNLVMKALAKQLSRVLREGDMLARLSHDGFVFLLRERSDRSIQAAITQTGALLNAPVHCDSDVFKLVWGMGTSQYPQSGNSTQALIRAAMKLQREVGGEAKSAAKQQTISAVGVA
ncbi:MAG: MHYT domain-containing protein [Nevskia sp.]|nr:MHYT domain-containing protein [Nevskia sp.]